MRIDADGNVGMQGTLTMNNIIIGKGNAVTDINTANDTGSLSVRGSSSTPAVMSFHRVGSYAVNFGLDGNDMKLGGWSAVSTKFNFSCDNGNLTATGDVIANNVPASDARLKDNVTTIDGALDKVLALRGVEFDWTATSREGQHDIGVIAQEIETVIPEVVREHKIDAGDLNDVYKTVDYAKLTAVLIEAIKELKSEIEELKKQ